MTAPFDITSLENGTRVATDGSIVCTMVDTDGHVFRRRAVKVSGGVASNFESVVLRLDGVSVYVSGNTVVVTRADLYP